MRTLRWCGRTLSSAAAVAPRPEQLRAVFVCNAIPMVGFGFMDQTVMVHAGNAIDMTFGVTFGFSTLTAAAMGQICSDVAGVTFGGAIETLAAKCGLPDPKLSSSQNALRVVKRYGFAGRILGVVVGCVLGLTNLLMVDATKTQQLKLEKHDEGHSVSVSNRERKDATTVVVEGPDTDGLLASIATTLAAAGYSLMEVRGGPVGDKIMDVFTVTKAGQRVHDDELEYLARCVVDACRNPKQARALQVDNDRLRAENQDLRDKVDELTHERRVRIARTDTRHFRALTSSRKIDDAIGNPPMRSRTARILPAQQQHHDDDEEEEEEEEDLLADEETPDPPTDRSL
ncbi:hypothetical protein CTAYLR_001615 [Chrysophaeum taylorii]|uniref:ACT domain-containing protein n=1 Tax=Chrysophaeum taylorii TaxID=2483200 RepID=A0AAD7UBT9_9STRA|nr:hypothetical protein CTAYLR_001615 [Chrysophaeum taylorii]